MNTKRWIVMPPDKEAASRLAEEYEINPFLALMLATRGITDPMAADEFLLGGEPEDPYAFADMDLAVERIQRAIDSGEKMAVYGDYDADGVTSTVLLYSYLQSAGGRVEYYIPDREKEGYGLSDAGVDALAEHEVTLIVTVDNGISAAEQVARAAEKGIDVVVTDHHQPPEALPRAVAVVNPHRADCESRFKEYAGVGVAYKLVCALEGDGDAVLEQYGDLIALGTLADVVPLLGENRMLVREGLRLINENRRPGLRCLRQVAGRDKKDLNATGVAFTLAPRINAAGRMDSPLPAARLLLAGEESEAAELAAMVHQFNIDRQSTEAAILEQVAAKLEREPERLHDRVLVIDGEGWHPGVVGIIAARVMERYGKPCILLSVQGEAAKGSGRSLTGFNLYEAVKASAGALERFGGHEMAVGVGLDSGRIGEFRSLINEYAAQVYPEMPSPELRIDCKLNPAHIDMEKISLLDMMEPFGAQNPSPVFGLWGMRLDNITPIGQGKHLRLSVSRDGARLSVLKFGCGVDAFPYECGQTVNLAVTLDKDEYNGKSSVSVKLKDIRAADVEQEALIAAGQRYDRVMRGEALTAEEQGVWRPRREELGTLYRYLRARSRWSGPLEQLAFFTVGAAGDGAAYTRLLLSLEALKQAGLITLNDVGDALHIALLPAAGKADLEATPVMTRLTG